MNAWRTGRELPPAVVIEKSDQGYGAYVPDLPGVISVGDSQEEVKVSGTLVTTFRNRRRWWL